MNDCIVTQPPISDVNGNAGTHAPQCEIFYEVCGIKGQKNAGGCEGR